MAVIDQATVQSFVDMVRPAVEATAQALSTTAENLWAVGIGKQYVDGIFYSMMTIGLIVATVVFYKIAKRLLAQYKVADKGLYSSNDDLIVGTIFSIIGAVTTFCILWSTLYSALLHLIVPQYTLIMEIMSKINGTP